jgi:integrase
MNTHTPPTLKKINGIYHARVQTGKTSKFITTRCTDKAEAKQVLATSSLAELNRAAKADRLTQRAIGQIVAGKNLTCAKALDTYCQIKSANKSPKTIANNRLVLTNWFKVCHLESLPPSAITVDHISKWINNPKSEWRLSMRQVALASVRTFFEFCGDQGWLVSDPSKLVSLDYKVMSHAQKEPTEKEPFTEDEVKHMLAELNNDWQRAQTGKQELFREPTHVLFWLVAVHIGKDTGLRLSDIAQLEWRCFSEGGKLVVWTAKTNRRMEYPVSAALENLIGEVPVIDSEYLFPEQRAIISDPAKRSGLSVQFGRLCDRLEIKDRSFHSLRHFKAISAYSKLDKNALAKKLASILSMSEIKQLLGHASAKTSAGYVHEKGPSKNTG